MIPRAFVLAAALIALSGCTPTVPPTAELVVNSVNSIDIDGVERTYSVWVPDGLADPAPLLIVLHGAGGTGSNIEGDTGFTGLAEGFIVAYPNGTPRNNSERWLAWNSGRCCGAPSTAGVDDVGFLTALMDTLEVALPVDPERVYVTGFSNGGMMSYRLACELDGRLAGIAVVSGAFNAGDCDSPDSLDVLIIHGTEDPVIPYDGSDNPTTKTSLVDTAAFWAEANGCSVDPLVTSAEKVSSKLYPDCDRGTTVELVTIDGGGHVWSKTGVGASAHIIDFFDLN